MKKTDMKEIDLKRTMVNFLVRYAKEFQEELLRRIPNDYSVKKTISVTVENYQIVINAAEYLQYLEKGRMPGSKPPPTSAILEWIKIKSILPRADQSGKIPKKEQLAFVIARSIGKNGIAPKNYIKDTKKAVDFETADLIKDMEIKIINQFKNNNN